MSSSTTYTHAALHTVALTLIAVVVGDASRDPRSPIARALDFQVD